MSVLIDATLILRDHTFEYIYGRSYSALIVQKRSHSWFERDFHSKIWPCFLIRKERVLLARGTEGSPVYVGRFTALHCRAFSSSLFYIYTMTRERTFLMVKPEGVQRGIVGEIVQRFERRGYQLIAAKLMKASDALLREHYEDLQSKPFFAGLVKHMSSGPVFAMVFEGSNVVKVARMMLGETNPLSSLPGSIRGDFAIDIGRNVCHGSDSVDSADREIKLWFPEGIISYELPHACLIYEKSA